MPDDTVTLRAIYRGVPLGSDGWYECGDCGTTWQVPEDAR